MKKDGSAVEIKDRSALRTDSAPETRTRVLACSCNRTVALDGAFDEGGATIAGNPTVVAQALCRREVPRFLEALDGTDDVLVTCTQEAPLFRELAQARRAVAPVRFVNIREAAGWGREGARAAPKIAALVAMAAATVDEPVPTVGYRSGGSVLIVGDAGASLDWAERLADSLSVSVLLTGRAYAALPARRTFPVSSGDEVDITGWLGAFEVRWKQCNPIDLDACVRCGACVAACPEGAIGPSLQIDSERCRDHRDCVAACAAIGAIDFARGDVERSARYDLILDLRRTPAFRQHEPPPGYLHAGADPDVQLQAVLKLSSMVGEFEKPKFFRYDARICAHGRSGRTGCTACIDVCSTGAIRSDGDTIHVEPQLCMGCGGCTTVCPSGAISYGYPPPPALGARLRAALGAYRARGGSSPSLLFHDGEHGQALIESLARTGDGAPGPASCRPQAPGLPADLIPVPVHHVASVGLDLALAAIAWGAASVTALLTPDTAAQYAEALEAQFETGQRLLAALGLGGARLVVLRTGDRLELSERLHRRAPLASVGRPASFALPHEKRRAIDFALAHLVEQAPAEAARAIPREVALRAGAPFGTLMVHGDRCTLCMACAGACPEGALLDGNDTPQLRFIERNCVQCGLCANICPEEAITLQPRYLFDEEAKSARVLNEAQPFNCVSCGRPFGTRRMIEGMTARLAGHPMFSGTSVARLQMCADCRVVDMFSSRSELTIHDVADGGAR